VREFKFRAWDTREKEMIYAEEAKGSNTLLAVGLHGLPIAVDSGSFREDEIIGWNVDHFITLMQYTGLLDKHGKEIYEGDIVLWRDEEYPIIFDKGAWVLQGSISFASFFDGEFTDLWNVHEYAEVVGSIHDEQEPLARESMI
jgi:uncharacterized phage protein (TIGR01671 family)